jgi:hypothetical protein
MTKMMGDAVLETTSVRADHFTDFVAFAVMESVSIYLQN